MIAIHSQLAGCMAAVLIGLASATEVKETVRLVLSGGDLRKAVTIEDPALLAESNVFRGSFIGRRATEPDPSWPRYLVVFDVQTLHGVKSHAYVVRYAAHKATGNAFIYLPGEQDAFYLGNISTILREGRDGHWHEASPAWARALNEVIVRVGGDSQREAEPPRP